MLAVLTRLHAPQLYLAGDSDNVLLALPSLLLPGLPGALLAALVAAGAFAAFLSTSSGLLVSVAGALSHDFMNRGVTSFRWCAIAAGAVATAASLLIGRFSLALLVGWAFAIAASSFCPLLVLGIWWRQLTRAGAAAGIVVGGGACLAAILATMTGAATRGWSAVLLGQPGHLDGAARVRRDDRDLTAYPADPARQRRAGDAAHAPARGAEPARTTGPSRWSAPGGRLAGDRHPH